jgi:2-methylcitrate dehydratase PrpD|uniref:MmgE/PrpD family protein n=1 Tax=uncultured Acidovorax sp. TaxID=158751 RepID=UPI00076AB216|nr:MmgE/PrpD family protein [uncultured Acidovorax sp.]
MSALTATRIPSSATGLPPRITQELAARSAALCYTDLPEDVRLRVCQCLLDWIGVTLAGACEPLVHMLAEEAREQGGHAQATVVGHAMATSTRQAALINGAASHALDYDDVNMACTGHPSVVLIPALLALAESRGVSGRDFMTAFAAGYETMCLLGLATGEAQYAKGFHTTATLGTIGAAAACARLLQLDADDTATAFGIASTMAAGLKSMFGTMCKPLHAGRASADGLQAAQLAARGFTSCADAIECPQGFMATHGGNASLETAVPNGGWHLRHNLFKFHAACYGTHAAIEAARRLRLQHALRPEDVRFVTVRVGAASEGVCNIAEPLTGLEAKFSLRHTVAMALAGVDTAGLDSFSDDAVHAPDVVALRERVTVELAPQCPGLTLGEVVIETHTGTMLRQRHDSGRPAKDLHEQQQRLEDKFRRLVEPVLDASERDALIDMVARLDTLTDLSPLAGMLARRACARLL